MNLFTVVFCILLVLKLLEVVTYSWWIIFSPLIIGFIISFAVIFIALLNKDRRKK
jgi:hypothetical protein